MSSLAPAPSGLPLGGAVIDGTLITVDDYVNPASRIPEIVRNLVADNEGYFIEDVFSTPGFTVQGGAIIYTPTFPQDLFLDPEQTLGSRAPGTEAPLIAGKRYTPQVARPESKAGRIEVTDEAKQRNQVWDVQNSFQKAANSFADYMQARGVQALNDAVTAWSRTTAGVNWRTTHSTGLVDVDPTTLPINDFGVVLKQFRADKAGVRPDTLILHENDAFYLDLVTSGPYMTPGAYIDALLKRYGISNYLVSPHATEGTAIFLKSKQVGVIAFEKPLDQEYERQATRKQDVYVLEMRPVFVAQDASAVLAVTGIDGH
jgi:hypothetical protein